MKRVKFNDIPSPKLPKKCKCCGFRNIKPQLREFFVCSKCSYDCCVDCFIYGGDMVVICIDCLPIKA